MTENHSTQGAPERQETIPKGLNGNGSVGALAAAGEAKTAQGVPGAIAAEVVRRLNDEVKETFRKLRILEQAVRELLAECDEGDLGQRSNILLAAAYRLDWAVRDLQVAGDEMDAIAWVDRRMKGRHVEREPAVETTGRAVSSLVKRIKRIRESNAGGAAVSVSGELSAILTAHDEVNTLRSILEDARPSLELLLSKAHMAQELSDGADEEETARSTTEVAVTFAHFRVVMDCIDKKLTPHVLKYEDAVRAKLAAQCTGRESAHA